MVFPSVTCLQFFLILATKELIGGLLMGENEFGFKLLGIHGHYIGIRRVHSAALISFSILSLSSHLIYYNNHRNGIKTTFLGVVAMMSGLVTPKSIGLTDDIYIRRLLKKMRISIKLLTMNNYLGIPVGAFFMMLALYYYKTTPIDTLVFGIPNAILYFIWSSYCIPVTDVQLLLFYAICSQLRFRINSLNKTLIKIKRTKDYSKIRQTLQSFDSLYNEINGYNTTFWSKFLLVFWVTIGSCDVFLIHVCIFGRIPIWLIITFVYCSLFLFGFFIFIIFTASSVNHSVYESYKSLNSLNASISKQNRFFVMLSTRIKVFFIHLIVLLIYLFVKLI